MKQTAKRLTGSCFEVLTERRKPVDFYFRIYSLQKIVYNILEGFFGVIFRTDYDKRRGLFMKARL